MRYSVRHTTIYTYTEPVSICHNQVHLEPRATDFQLCLEHQLTVDPLPAVRTRRLDFFGNRADYFSIQDAHAGLNVIATSVVEVTAPPRRGDGPPWEEIAAGLPEDRSDAGLAAYQCSLPSPRISPEEPLREYALPSFPRGRPIAVAARDLVARIHADFKFDPRATTVTTPPLETLTKRRGVCQDFAHLALGCLRSLGLAARYVSGYVSTTPPPGTPRLIGADASHAWISVYGGPLGWVDLDPTNNAVVTDSHVTVGWGRDYGDVCPIQGVFVGGGDHSVNVGVDVLPISG